MRRETVIILAIATAVLGVVLGAAIQAYSQDEPELWIKADGFSYKVSERSMSVRTQVPLINDRMKTYGSIQVDPKGNRTVDTLNKTAVTPTGEKMYLSLMTLRTESGVFLIFNVTLGHANAFITKYDHFSWDEILPRVLEVLDGGLTFVAD